MTEKNFFSWKQNKRNASNILVEPVPVEGIKPDDSKEDRSKKILIAGLKQLEPDATKARVKEVLEGWEGVKFNANPKIPDHLPLHVLGWARDNTGSGATYVPMVATYADKDGNPATAETGKKIYVRVTTQITGLFNTGFRLRKKMNEVALAAKRASQDGKALSWETIMGEEQLLFTVKRDGEDVKVPILSSNNIKKNLADKKSACTKTTMAPPDKSKVKEVMYPFRSFVGIEKFAAKIHKEAPPRTIKDVDFSSGPGCYSLCDPLPAHMHVEKMKVNIADRKAPPASPASSPAPSPKKGKKDKKDKKGKKGKKDKKDTPKKDTPKTPSPAPPQVTPKAPLKRKSDSPLESPAGSPYRPATKAAPAKRARASVAQSFGDNTLDIQMRKEGALCEYLISRAQSFPDHLVAQAFEKSRLMPFLRAVKEENITTMPDLYKCMEHFFDSPKHAIAVFNYIFVVNEPPQTQGTDTFVFGAKKACKSEPISEDEHSGTIKRVVRLFWSTQASSVFTIDIIREFDLDSLGKEDIQSVAKMYGQQTATLMYAATMFGAGVAEQSTEFLFD